MMRSIALSDAPTIRETTGQRIRRLRTEHGWSQARLAEIANMTPQAIQQAETRNIDMHASTLEGLADALGVTMGELWRGRP